MSIDLRYYIFCHFWRPEDQLFELQGSSPRVVRVARFPTDTSSERPSYEYSDESSDSVKLS